MINESLILGLADCRDNELVGGKGLNLAKLIQAGFPVPGGFVITTAAYNCSRRDDVMTMPADLEQDICRFYKEMGSPPVAVRSSATAEDMADASMAGQYETYLNIETETDLIDAVKNCWASIDTPRTRAYLKEHHIDIAEVAMAVVVQRLVASDVAGVLFTSNPRTGAAEMMIEGSWGLGESVVSGIVQPDILRVDRATGTVLESKISDKKIWIPFRGDGEQEVDEAKRNIACMTSQNVYDLWQLGLRAADHFEAAQDLEWGIENGELLLLQSRNVTTLEDAEAYEELLQSTRATLKEKLEEGHDGWALHNLAETLPHATPFTWSVIKRFMSGSGGFGSMYREVGFDPSDRVNKDGFLDRIAGKVYMDLERAPEMFFEGFPFKYDLEYLQSDPNAGQAPPTTPCGTFMESMRVGRKLGKIGTNMQELAKDLDTRLVSTIIPEFEAWVKEEKKRDLSKLSNEQWMDLWGQREKKVMDEFAPDSLLPSLILGMAVQELKAFLQENFWNDDPDDIVNLISTHDAPDFTVRANCELYLVAMEKKTAESWIEEFGHRAPTEFDLATLRWNERPDELISMASHLAGGVNPSDIHEKHVAESSRRVEELRAQLSPRATIEFDEKLDLVRRYVRFREDGKYYLMMGYELLRDMGVEAGRRMNVGEGIFLLSLDEVQDSLNVGYAPLHLIDKRAKQRRAEARLIVPHTVTRDTIDALGEPPKIEGGNRMTAFPLSSGAAAGPARIVRSPEEAGDLGKDYVLVCPSTDPSWTPLFVNAAGLVLECGGTLSHGAVVAREMGIPSVVLANATAIFEEGENIHVDGQNGAVTKTSGAGDQVVDTGPDPDNTRFAPELVPPPVGSKERFGTKIRNVFLSISGVVLGSVFLLPAEILHDPFIALLDRVLWPLVAALGHVHATIAIVAVLATVMMIAQWLATDNQRLREAKKRSEALKKGAVKLPDGSARKLAMNAMVAPLQMRLSAGSFVALSILLIPFIMAFTWMSQRIDPAMWNTVPGTPVTIQATIKSDCREPISLSMENPLHLDEFAKATRTLPLVRETLEALGAEWQDSLGEVSEELPWAVKEAGRITGEAMLADLDAYLDSGIPAEKLAWTVYSSADSAGSFPVTLTAGKETLSVNVVLGNQCPPSPAEALGSKGSMIESIMVKYPTPKEKPEFWRPLAFMGLDVLHLGWIWTYLAIYVPIMFILKAVLRIP